MKKLLLLASLFGASIQTYADDIHGKVNGILVSHNKEVLIKLDDGPSCIDESWTIKFSTDDGVGKEWYSLLLSAKARDKELTIRHENCKITAMWEWY